MKRLLLTLFFMTFSIGSIGCVPDAQLPDTRTIDSTWAALRTAILANNIQQAVQVSHFPLKSIDHFHKDVANAEDFEDRFSAIFEPDLITIIRADDVFIGPGDPGLEVDIGNGYMILGFEQFDGHYRLTYFGSINE